MTDQERLDQLSINTIRTLAIDAIQKARSGHPGTPMGVAPVAYTLWQRFLRFDPDHPIWPNRDRFVLSSGHASMLLYALLHLTGVKAVNPKYEVLGEVSVSLDAIKSFRQLGSKCPGHPEYRWTSGIETTTGPLGQGVATSVGMAIAAHWMAQHFNRPGFTMFDYDVYALCGDGCMMEGISSEAASLAGHLRLANLCWIYDRNKVTIEGHTDLAFTEDVATRFLGYDWNVTRVSDANDQAAIERALTSFKRTNDRPTLIVVESHIGYGAPHKEDTSAAHGEPLGDEEVRLTKRNYGWPENAQFLVPDGVREHFQAGMGQRGRALRDAWMAKFVDYQRQYPDLADQLDADAAARAAGRVGSRSARLPGRRQGHRQPGLVGAGPECPCPARPLADGRRRRSLPVDEDPPHLPRRGGLPGRHAGWAKLPLRHPRARHGRGHQRSRPVQGPALRLGFPDLQRLRARLAAPGRASWRSRSSTCSPTIPSAWARTGPRISPSSTSPRSAPFPDSSPSGPGTPTR